LLAEEEERSVRMMSPGKKQKRTTDGTLTSDGKASKLKGGVDWQSLHRLLAQELCEPFTEADCRSLLHELTNDASLREMDLGAAFSSCKISTPAKFQLLYITLPYACITEQFVPDQA
jgi:hypothetical protein